MTESTYDAVIIGAGVIGACTAYELAKKGWKTLSIDKLPEAGYGSTSGSCAIIRTYYSAFETCAIAYEDWHYWKDWPGYVGGEDEQGLFKYHDTGCLVIKTDHNRQLSRVCDMMDRLGCPYEHVETARIPSRLPNADTRQYEPAKRPDDEGFGLPTGPAPCRGRCSSPAAVTSTTPSCRPTMLSGRRSGTERNSFQRRGRRDPQGRGSGRGGGARRRKNHQISRRR